MESMMSAVDVAFNSSWRRGSTRRKAPLSFAGALAVLATVAAVSAAAAESAVGAYERVVVKPAGRVLEDASFEAFRVRALAMAEAGDWQGLQSLLAPNFFWDRDFGAAYDPAATPAANFARAFSQTPDATQEGRARGLEDLRAMLNAEGAVERRDGHFCLPGEWTPADEALAIKVTERAGGAWPFDLVIVKGRDIPVYSEADSTQVVAALSEEGVRILENGDGAKIRVALPSGEEGFIAADDVEGLVDPRLCFAKLEDQWRISGYVGGGD
jgi:hypothetical protein